MIFAELIERFKEAIVSAVIQTYPPLYDAVERGRGDDQLARLLRKPLGAQADAIKATRLALTTGKQAMVVGEMGCGKSLVGISAGWLAGMQRVLVLCPPHLVQKWEREVKTTIPKAQTAIVRSLEDVRLIRQLQGAFQVVILSREKAKLSYRWRPSYLRRPVVTKHGHLLRDKEGDIVYQLVCPSCGQPILDKDGIPATVADLTRKRRWCDNLLTTTRNVEGTWIKVERACGGALWEADRTGPRRYAIADYLKRYFDGYFDLLIVDEQHEYKAKGSAQGLAAAALAECSNHTLALTGTIFGGYASTLFYLLWRFSGRVREEFGYNDELKWVLRYGIIEHITREGNVDDEGRVSKRRGYSTRTVERPGMTPAILFHLIANTVFLKLADVSRDLPPYLPEQILVVPMDTEPLEIPQIRNKDGNALRLSQSQGYHILYDELKAAVATALATGSKRLLGIYVQALLAYPDAPYRGETIVDPRDQSVIVSVPPFPEGLPGGRLYPKEQALLDLCLKERARGRRVLVYVTHTATRDITPRLQRLLQAAGLKTAVLKSNTVKSEDREGWVSDQVRGGVNVLICHPKLVQTGLDLVDFPSIVWFEVEYSVYVMRQASRRSWRIGQKQPVQVTYFVYEQTMQAQALALVAAKLKSALMIEGELPEEGLAALETDDAEDLFVALAKQIVQEAKTSEQSLEAIFQQARADESDANAFLAPEDWHVTVPEPSVPEPEIQLPAQEVRTTPSPVDAPAAIEPAPATLPPPVEVSDAAARRQVKTLTFEDLRKLVATQPKPRRAKPKATPGQLSLFEAADKLAQVLF